MPVCWVAQHVLSRLLAGTVYVSLIYNNPFLDDDDESSHWQPPRYHLIYNRIQRACNLQS
jgi:hypothetical protein